ncbi:MAG: hypothetical protein ACLP22_12870, partial [Solirubrobacteraceae bacterium]
KPSLLPGLLAATRTGLTPAGDDKLALKITNYISTSNYWVNGTAHISPKVSGAASGHAGVVRMSDDSWVAL